MAQFQHQRQKILRDDWRDPGNHATAFKKSAPNAGLVIIMTKRQIHVLIRLEKPAYGRTILMNATKTFTLRETLPT
jgi:hypothetical protein